MAIVASGTSFIYISKTAYEAFIETLEAQDFTCKDSSTGELLDICYSKQACSAVVDNLSDLVFTMNEEIFTIPPAGYLMENYDKAPCSAFVSYAPDVSDMYILGTTFMRNFYITFDYLDSTMTFTSKWNTV